MLGVGCFLFVLVVLLLLLLLLWLVLVVSVMLMLVLILVTVVLAALQPRVSWRDHLAGRETSERERWNLRDSTLLLLAEKLGQAE